MRRSELDEDRHGINLHLRRRQVWCRKDQVGCDADWAGAIAMRRTRKRPACVSRHLKQDVAVVEPTITRRGTRSPFTRQHTTPKGSALFAWYLLIAGVLMLFLSRASVAFAAIPTAINFVHFPLIFGAFVLSRSDHRTSAQRAGERILLISLVLAFAAVIGSTATPALQTALVWAVLVEPIVVILTVWNLTTRGHPVQAPRNLALFVVLAQFPLAIVQWVLFGRGDNVQGLLVNQGAGHHLLGALGLVVAVVALNRLLTNSSTTIWLAVLVLAAGITLPLLYLNLILTGFAALMPFI